MQIFEGFLVAAHKTNANSSTCFTKTIFERLVQPPPRLDLHCLECADDYAKTFLGDLRCGNGAKVHAMLTWPSMKSVVYGMAETSHPELIGTRIRERPKDHFLKLYWVKAVLGRDNLGGWQDLVTVPPEQKKLDNFLQTTSDILKKDPSLCNNDEKAWRYDSIFC